LSDKLQQFLARIPTRIYFLVLFIVCIRLDTLNLPIYWDESIYYTPDIFKHGLSTFLPDYYNPKNFHGHPVLFQILLYFSSCLFGPTPLAAHILSLIIFIGFIFASYNFIQIHFGKTVSIFTLYFFISIPFVFIQGAMFVPNYLMIGLALTAFHYYLKDDLNKYMIFAFLAVMTRESALAFFFLPGLITLTKVIKKQLPFKYLFHVSFPLIALIGFLKYNSYISGNLVNHPYVRMRMDRNEILIDKLIRTFGESLHVLADSTIKLLPSIIGIIIVLLFTYKIIKNRHLIFNKPFVLLLSSAILFSLFFLFYGDTIVRDFTFVTYLFSFIVIFTVHQYFKREALLALFCLIFLCYQLPFHFNKYTQDQSWNSFIYRVKSYKAIAQLIMDKYPDARWVKCAWPCLNLFERREFGYIDYDMRTTIYDWEADIMLISKMNTSLDYAKTDYSIWEKQYFYKKNDNIAQAIFYKKIKEVKRNENE
jgi:hypothetical protein